MNVQLNIVTRLALLVIMVLNLFGSGLQATTAAPLPASLDKGLSADQAAGAVRTVILYSSDTPGAQALADLLNLHNFDASLHQIAGFNSYTLFLPLVVRGGQNASTLLQFLAASGSGAARFHGI